MTSKLILELLKKGKSVSVKVEGRSMYPSIQQYDNVVISDKPDKIKISDILCFKTSNTNSFIIHRVLWCFRDQLLIAGDNNMNVDPLISKSDVIGKITSIHRNKRVIKDNYKYYYVLKSFLKFFLYRETKK